MAHIEVVRASLAHVVSVAFSLRRADYDECLAMGGPDVPTSITKAFENSRISYAVLIDGACEAVFGVVPNLPAGSLLGDLSGFPWFLATDKFSEIPKRAFVRESWLWVAELLCRYPVLVGYVDDRHGVAKRWLEFMGFTLFDPEPYGCLKLPFRRFEKRRG